MSQNYFRFNTEVQFEVEKDSTSKSYHERQNFSHHYKKILIRKKLTRIAVVILIVSLISCLFYIADIKLFPFVFKTSKLTSSLISSTTLSDKIFPRLSMNRNQSNLEIIYKASVHGDSYDDFLTKVDSTQPLVVLFQTDDNRIFGAYLNQFLKQGQNELNIDAVIFSFESGISYYIMKRTIEIDDVYFMKIGEHFEVSNGCISKHRTSIVKMPFTIKEEQLPNRPDKEVYIKEIEAFKVKK